MKKRHVCSGLLISMLVFFSMSMTSPASAARGYNITLRGTEDQSKKASVLIFQGISSLFASIGALEAEQPKKFNESWNSALTDLKGAKTIFIDTLDAIERGKIKDEGIDIGKIPEPCRANVEDYFHTFKLSIPKTKSKLLSLAVNQVQNLIGFLSEISFQNNDAQNRRVLWDINRNVYQFLAIGISVSEIAASNKSVK